MEICAGEYLQFIQRKLVNLLDNITVLSTAGDAAAERIVSGGKLWGLSDEKGFISEFSSRSGGLMCIHEAPEPEKVSAADVIVAASTDSRPDSYPDLLESYRATGALIILIGSREAAERPGCDIFIDTALPKGTAPLFKFRSAPACPTAGVVNVAALWAFTAEFVAACSRRGKVPVCWQSGVLDTGKARNKILKDRVFHDDGEFDVPPIAAGEKGREYLFNIQRCLASMHAMELEKFVQAGKIGADAINKGNTVWCDSIGHHLPSQEGIAGDPGILTLGFPERKDKAGPFKKGDVYFYNGYYIYPTAELQAAREAGIASVWILGGKDVQGIYAQPGEIHINAYWRYGDASLTIPGLDIKIIPASGVIMTTTLWMLVAETIGNLSIT